MWAQLVFCEAVDVIENVSFGNICTKYNSTFCAQDHSILVWNRVDDMPASRDHTVWLPVREFVECLWPFIYTTLVRMQPAITKIWCPDRSQKDRRSCDWVVVDVHMQTQYWTFQRRLQCADKEGSSTAIFGAKLRCHHNWMINDRPQCPWRQRCPRPKTIIKWCHDSTSTCAFTHIHNSTTIQRSKLFIIKQLRNSIKTRW